MSVVYNDAVRNNMGLTWSSNGQAGIGFHCNHQRIDNASIKIHKATFQSTKPRLEFRFNPH